MKQNADRMILEDNWSDLSQHRELPNINHDRMHDYRMGRIKEQMRKYDVDVFIMHTPLSMRYAINFRSYSLFSMHIPCTYVFLSLDAPYLIHNALDLNMEKKHKGQAGIHLSHFYGGIDLDAYAERFAKSVEDYLIYIGTSNRKVAIEHVNPSIMKALMRRDLEVIDGALIIEESRLIKSEDEIECIRWSIAVAEHGADMMKKALKPGVTETQLWGIINYTNLTNNGDWHDGRMLASGRRINPWLQEASDRKVESGDLVGFDTDMIGPFGYCADLSRTFHCGPAKPTARQKQLYHLSFDEVETNLNLIKAGAKLSEIQEQAYPTPEEFQQQAYPCVIHGVGMADEYPHLDQIFRRPIEFDRELKEGMVICVESYIGAVGETDGVKLEQQVLVTDDGYELLTTYPYEAALLE